MALNKTLRYIGISCLFLLPLLALIVSTSLFFPYITGKNFIFRLLVEIAFVCWAILAFRDTNYRPRWRSPIVIAVSLFMVIMFFADLFGENFYKSFWSNFERMEGYITFLHLWALFFVASSLLNSRKLWNRLFHLIFAIGIVLGFVGLYQHFHSGIERIDATLGNSTYLGALMIFNIFLLLIYMMRAVRSRSANWKWISGGYVLAIIFDFYILLLTGTRSALLGVGGGFVLIAIVFAFSKKEEKVIRYAGRSLLGLIVVALVFIVAFQNTPLIKNHSSFSRLTEPVDALLTGHIKEYAESGAGGGGRLLIWGAALKGFEARPILGWGQENFNYIFNFYYTPAMYGQEQWFDRAHNVFLDWLTQGGILGLLSYLAMFGILIYALWKKRNSDFNLEEKAILTGLLIAYFIHNFFVFDSITSYILFFSMMAYINRVQFEHIHAVRNHRTIHPDVANFALAPIVVIVAICALWFGVYRPYVASAALIQALLDEQSGNVGAIYSDFQRALIPHTFGSAEAREQILLVLPAVASDQNLDVGTKTKIITFAENQMDDQLKRTPNDARYFLFYGYALDHVGDQDSLKKANGYLVKALSLSPAKQSIMFELGLNYLAQGDNNDSLNILKKAYDSAPSYDEAHTTYAMTLIYTGHFAEAKNLLQGADMTVLNDDRLLKAYFIAKQYQSAIDIYHARQAASSSDPQNYLGAAGFYMVMGQSNAAILEIQKLEKVHPEYLSQLDGYISQIRAGKNPLPIK